MTTPLTEVDSQYSDPGAEATDWAVTRQRLESAELFWICTVRADGRPHMTPLVAVWLDGALYFSTGEGEQKEVNLRRNKHVILMTGCNSWDEGLDVMVEGDAARVTDKALLQRLAAAWTAKWDGRWQFGVGDGCFTAGDGQAQVYGVTPAKALAFAKGNFSHTRHKFPA
jgi:general stress protein 26